MNRRLLPALLSVLSAALVGAAVGLLAVADRPWWAGVAGAVLGGGGAAGIAVLAGRGSSRLTDGAHAQRVAGLPLVAHVPPPGTDETDRRRAAEAFRMLRAALVAAPSDASGGPAADGAARAGAPAADGSPAVALGPGRAGLLVVVTSAAPGEGKTTVAAGLARALARAGRPVVAVEADLRRPALARALGVAATAERGLTAAIVGGVAVADLLVEAEPGLRLLPAGELPPNAPELLGSDDGARVLSELAALGVDVVLDTAPLLPVADTRELLARAGGHRTVLVVRPGVVDADELRAAVGLLAPASGAVLAVSGRAPAPRSYDAYLRDGSRA